MIFILHLTFHGIIQWIFTNWNSNKFENIYVAQKIYFNEFSLMTCEGETKNKYLYTISILFQKMAREFRYTNRTKL